MYKRAPDGARLSRGQQVGDGGAGKGVLAAAFGRAVLVGAAEGVVGWGGGIAEALGGRVAGGRGADRSKVGGAAGALGDGGGRGRVRPRGAAAREGRAPVIDELVRLRRQGARVGPVDVAGQRVHAHADAHAHARRDGRGHGQEAGGGAAPETRVAVVGLGGVRVLEAEGGQARTAVVGGRAALLRQGVRV